MKILHVDTQKGFRGGEQQLLWLVEGLSEFGVESVVACKKEEKLYERCMKKNIAVVSLSGNQIVDIFKIANASKNFDIVHAHAAKSHTVCAFAKALNKKRLVYTRRVDYKPKSNIVTDFKYKKTDKIVAISNFVADVLKSSLKIEGSIDVVYSSTDTMLQDKIDMDEVLHIKSEFNGFPLIGTAAALSPQKNIPNLINAAGFVLKKYPKAKFVVAGEGKLQKKLSDEINKKGLSGNFKLIGFKNDIENYIKAFDIFVLPSDFEGLGSTLLSAMVLKVPIVATDAGGAREVIIHNKTGILVAKKNSEELAKGIIKLIEDKRLANTLTAEAYRFVTDSFSTRRMAEKYFEIYKNLLNEH